jgi:hypothetical protein
MILVKKKLASLRPQRFRALIGVQREGRTEVTILK